MNRVVLALTASFFALVLVACHGSGGGAKHPPGKEHDHTPQAEPIGNYGPSDPAALVSPFQANSIFRVIKEKRDGQVRVAGRDLPYIRVRASAVIRGQDPYEGKVVGLDIICGGFGTNGLDAPEDPNHTVSCPPDARLLMPTGATRKHLDVGCGFAYVDVLSPSDEDLPTMIEEMGFTSAQVEPIIVGGRVVSVKAKKPFVVPFIPWVITRGKRLGTGAIGTNYVIVMEKNSASPMYPRLDRIYGRHNWGRAGLNTGSDPAYDVNHDQYTEWDRAANQVKNPTAKDSYKNMFIRDVDYFVSKVREIAF